MIDEKKLIEELEKEILQTCKNCRSDRYHTGMIAGMKRAKEMAASQPQADNWIPCSSGKLPKHEQQALITLEFANGRRCVMAATYYTETGIIFEDEWADEGFYYYDSEYGWCRYKDVIAWMPAEPYKGVE